MDDEYWAAYRKRARRRANSLGALIFCPLLIIGAAWWFVRPMDLPVGDIRNTIEFRLAFSGFFMIIGIAGLISSVRWLLADRRRS